jgi:hypothetical protein
MKASAKNISRRSFYPLVKIIFDKNASASILAYKNLLLIEEIESH